MNCYECVGRTSSEDRELNLRPRSRSRTRASGSPGGVFFVILVLAGATYDGLVEIPLQLNLVRLTPITQTLGLFVLPLFFLAVYLGGGTGRFVAAWVYSLVPLAIAYQVVPDLTYLLIHGQAIIALISDPFGRVGTSSAPSTTRPRSTSSRQTPSGIRQFPV